MPMSAVAAAGAPTPTLIYLPFRAMAETTRMLFAYGRIEYKDEAVWGRVFYDRRQNMDFPWGKTPVLQVPGYRTIAQSGALSRYAAKCAGIYPEDPIEGALSDSIYELGQELCTINPLVNCFVGQQFENVRKDYFSSVLPLALMQLEVELTRAQAASGGTPFFGGFSPTHGDFNVFHHLDNAMLLEPDVLHNRHHLEVWYATMRKIPQLKEYLEKRPTLNGIGEDPGLEDRNGVRITQRSPSGQAWLKDGLWHFEKPEE
mmetsp:Transcript_6620/g.15170  ORF Transcript_6620/g.15170 Transcript_6620/m.15170 type:complete len:259 (-) Transcript_6620:97-873(-)|eukprot:CAMPEP_0206592264 /NCGR_PEP_ID=MMETSP0325_2-20121206/40835_1 /ASSEMBLY_ACC=CAM_ASM_000347 /TAXON_ID=2866 /ORGANISM="Crypthecodinium cohnii, Strain Seligo" /LENGTH=258 /DNA_ID=CAMNT_0054101821 /DNA_START=134 /DNA_END=910 /DNA_ORIENTATION=-